MLPLLSNLCVNDLAVSIKAAGKGEIALSI